MSLAKAVVLLFCVALSCAAQIPIPDTPAGHQCAAWLDAYNSGDSRIYEAFLQKNYAPRHRRLENMRLSWPTSGFDLKKVEESTSTKVTVLVENRDSKEMERWSFEVEAAEPHRVTSWRWVGVARPPEFALPHMNEDDLIAALRKKLEQEVASDRFSGAVLLARNGKPVFEEAYGRADRERHIPNTLQTRFRIGSMNAMFTTVATLQLVQAGKLGLNDPFGKYLTDYPNQEVASRLTIHQLLTGGGGWGDFFGPEEYQLYRLELRTLQDYVRLFGSRRPEPGQASGTYTDYGFILLGLIIEKVSGQSYYDYINENVYKPAGMTSTGSDPEDQPVAGRSVGYTRIDGKAWRPNTDTLLYRGTSASGGYSTVEDLLRFAQASQHNKLLNAHSTELPTTSDADHGRNPYGFGDSNTDQGTRCHAVSADNAPGINANLHICPASGYVVVVLANMDPHSADRIAVFITDRLPQH